MSADDSGTEGPEVTLGKVPVKVHNVSVDGVGRTKDDIIVKQLNRILVAQTFEEMVKAAQLTKVQFERLRLFRGMGVFIDVHRGPESHPNGYDVVYRVEEQRRFTGGVSTLVGTNEASMLFGLNMPNLLGRAERFDADIIYGTKKALGWSLGFSKPIRGDPDLTFNTGIFQRGAEYPWSGFKQIDRGLFTDLSFVSRLGQHNLRWEGTWRELSSLSLGTALKVREQSGHNIKSSVIHTYTRDTRDSRVLPSHGSLVKLTQELAGLGGDARFIKQDLEIHLNKQLFSDFVFQLTLGGGIVHSLVKDAPLHISDRFFLGGPLTLRGFNLRGVGPQEDGCALGADVYWLAGAHLYTPLPFRPGRGGFGEYFRTHFFLNAGNLAGLDKNLSLKQNANSLAESLRLSYGVGLVLTLGGIARLELNYCVPVKTQPRDSVNPGVQLGVGIAFS